MSDESEHEHGKMNSSSPVVEHLFRHEAGKLVAVLTKTFGTQNLHLAEDVVQDTLLRAMQVWRLRGIPDNPTAWLLTVARNKALDVLRRERFQTAFEKAVSPLLQSAYSAEETIRQLIHEDEIEDDQLRMIFVCCHPSLSSEAQVALVLKTLCGFSVEAIARAFLTNEENISKRLYRARQQFREESIPFQLPATHLLGARLQNVLTCLYLIFNEGYNSSHHTLLIREDLVEEALRLGNLLLQRPATRQPVTLALMALMCFQAARLYTRVDNDGSLLLLKDQDRGRWDTALINQGARFLTEASTGDELSSYHLEAAIAFEHCIACTFEATNWKKILLCYEQLMMVRADEVVLLNRCIALAQVSSVEVALTELLKVANGSKLSQYYLFYATLGDWYTQLGDARAALNNFKQALELTHSAKEKEFLQQKIESLC